MMRESDQHEGYHVRPNLRERLHSSQKINIDSYRHQMIGLSFRRRSTMPHVDCDSHILPEDAFDEIPREFADEGPRIVNDAQGNSCVVYPARQRNIPDYARSIPNPFNPRPRSAGNRPEIRIADMAKADIHVQVLIPSNGSFYYDVEPELAAAVCRSYNNAIGRIIRNHPGKFIGVATLPMQEPKMAVQELDRAVRELGLRGPVCYTTVQDKDLDAEEFWPVYEKSQALGVPIIVHPVNTGPILGGWRMTRALPHSRVRFLERARKLDGKLSDDCKPHVRWRARRVPKTSLLFHGRRRNPSTPPHGRFGCRIFRGRRLRPAQIKAEAATDRISRSVVLLGSNHRELAGSFSGAAGKGELGCRNGLPARGYDGQLAAHGVRYSGAERSLCGS